MRWRREAAVPPDLAEAVARHAFAPAADPVASALAEQVHAAGGGAVRAVAFFGSRRSGAAPGRESAYDLLVVVEAYRPFYAALRRAGMVRRRPDLLAALNACLPPNQISVLGTGTADAARAKCAVVSAADLRRGTSEAAWDHFLLGRLAQPALILTGERAPAGDLIAALCRAHALTYAWVRPWLPATFDVDLYCRTFLRVSYGAEIRPEPEGRSDALRSAQAPYLRDVYGALLRGLAAAGEVVEGPPGTFALAVPATASERRRLGAYFQWSRVRATARWAKYVVTFDDWLDFIVAKARRHSGQDIVLTERERRHPLVFLWPRVVQYLLHKDQARLGPGRR